MNSYLVYILMCNDKTLYTGISTDVERRLHEHNFTDKGSKYVKARRPSRIVYVESFNSRSLALKREFKIKSMSRREKLSLISENKKTLKY